MGKYVLRGCSLWCSSADTSLELFIFLAIISIMAVSGNITPTNFRTPDHPQHKVNISQEEFETKHKAYFEIVEKNQRKRLRERGENEDGIIRKRLYRFSHSGIENTIGLPPGKQLPLHYFVNIPEDDAVHLDQISLRMLLAPNFCDYEGDNNVSIYLSTNGQIIAKEDLQLHNCLPKWDSIDLPRIALPYGPYGPLHLTIHCPNCPPTLALSHPTLNIIASTYVKRSRTRRAPQAVSTVKRRKYGGKCARHPLEINFSQLDGYNWIIEPKQFDAGICGGYCKNCPRGCHPANQHAALQIALAKMNRSVPWPKCVPHKLDSLDILHVNIQDPTKLEITVWSNTTIVDCACS